ncbi:mitochondrial 54S ribosomal protein mL67 [Colletotrichum truncatum]|uniref:Uncharacterized protein n=1 Tax=Colletotrichum truncatum TaxID=5467 RepID=A0ACC3YGJ8_COLTU|nr:uncharacterized protein CTRU02_11718 [Colletotrichum truncatum]KAF6785418.1 hypothetical protein CTRU02_11718 [Colletotrichum truncatum]
MNSVPVFRFSQLSFGVSRTSIRHGHVQSRRRVPQPELTKFPEGHGEQIWVWSHLTSNQVIYSHTKQLDSNRALRQLPFNGKKSKPAKLRRDYWQPLALIQLPKGAGAAGQSVFQKLREFRRLHELCWDDSLLFASNATEANPEIETKRVRGRFERGQALNDQRNNAIADMAAVLAGIGRGNRLHVSPKEKALLEQGVPLLGRKWSKIPPVPTAAVAGKKGKAEAASKLVEGAATETVADSEGNVVEVADGPDELLPATIYWAIDTDRNFAEKWSDNVTHDLLDNAVELTAQYEAEVVEQKEEIANSPVMDYKVVEAKA